MNNTPVRVLQFVDSDGVYGAERVVLNLSRGLQADSAVESVIGCIVPHASADNELYDAAVATGLKALKLPIPNSVFWLKLPGIAQQLRREGIQLMHSHGYKASVYGFLIRLLSGIPIMATCHLWFRPEHGPLKMRVMVAVEKYLYRWFPKVLAVSDDIRAVLLTNGVKPQCTDVIVNGVDIDATQLGEAERAALRASLNLPAQEFCVLNTARLTRQKAQWILIEAAAWLKSDGKRCQFLVVGAGELEVELRQLIARHEVADCVQLLGFRSDINQLLAACDVFALPSLDEGMPMSLLEAVAAGTPVIVTDVGDIGKLIVHEDSGLIIPAEQPRALADAILRLQADAALARGLSERANDRLIARYSVKAMCARYRVIYNDVVAGAA